MTLFVNRLLIVGVVLSLLGCQKSDVNNRSNPVAQVDQQILTLGELCEAVPNTLSKDDSILFANDFINRWVKSKLLIKRAELNLTPDEKDVDKLLNEYRSTLLIYKYEAKLIEQKYSSVITDGEIESYYNSSPDNFKLWEPIVKGVFVKVPKNLVNMTFVGNKYRSIRSTDLTELEGFCYQHAKKYLIFSDSWLTLSSIQQLLSAPIPNVEEVLKRDRFYTTTDNDFGYFFSINDVKWSGELAPLETVKDRIKAILINQTRQDFIKKTENDILNDGVVNGVVKYYKY